MSKRDNGTGTIYQRGSGSWAGKIYLGLDDNGKRKYKYFSGKSQAEIKRKIREYNYEGSKLQIKRISFKDYALDWLVTYKYGSVKPSTYDTLERTIKCQIIPYIGHIQLQQLTSDHIQKLLMTLKNEIGYSYSIVKKTHDCINAILKHAQIKGDIDENPMLLVNMPSKSLFTEKEIRFFTKEECALITEEATRKYSTGSPVYIYGDAFILMLHTGIRMGEAIGLIKSDWDKDKNILHIQRNVQSVVKRDKNGKPARGKQLVLNSTKTYSGDRLIPLNKNATEAIQRLCDAHPDSENIICSSKGSMVPPERMERTFQRMLSNIGIEKTGLHSLRHTFASMLFANNVDVKTVSHLLGHASIQITLNTYIHLIEGTSQDAVSVLEDL